MLIDWLTLKLCASKLDDSSYYALIKRFGRMLSISPDGEVEYETFKRESIRSDSHQIHVQLGGYLTVSGSPARLFPDNLGICDNVFGSLDIRENAQLMLDKLQVFMGVDLPPYQFWECTRIDVTKNYFCKSGAFGVDQLVSHFRSVETGKYGAVAHKDGLQISKGNRIESGKIYKKGQQLKKNYRKLFPDIVRFLKEDCYFDSVALDLAIDLAIKNNESERIKDLCIMYDRAEELSKRLKLASYICRFENQIGSRWLNERVKGVLAYRPESMRNKKWFELSACDLKEVHDKFFDERVGKGIDTMDSNKIKHKFIDSALELGFSEKLGLSAFKTWNLIKTLGVYNVWSKNNSASILSKAVFYRHRKVALNAGLTMADFETGNVVPFVRDAVELVEVSSWEELKRLVA